MVTTKQIRHHITRQPVIDAMLTWFQHRDVREHDVIFSSYPRSGSTWLRFMLCELLTGKETSFELVDQVLASIGYHHSAPRLLPNSGRILKTHEPYRGEYRRAIYLVRDVRDVVLSEYIFCRRRQYFTGEFNHFFESFLRGTVNRYGFWGDHVQSWLRYADEKPEQVLFIRFEDLRHNTTDIVKQCLDFLEVERTQVQIVQAVENHTLANMKQKEDQAKKFQDNAEGLRFVTDGAIGKGKQQLTREQIERLSAAAQVVLARFNYLKSAQ